MLRPRFPWCMTCIMKTDTKTYQFVLSSVIQGETNNFNRTSSQSNTRFLLAESGELENEEEGWMNHEGD